jgi:polygalacturonase
MPVAAQTTGSDCNQSESIDPGGMRAILLSVLAGAASWALAAGLSCNVVDMGAVGDGKTDNTAIMRRALLLCDQVLVPSGVFLTGPLNVTRSNFLLDVMGTLRATDAVQGWPVMPHLPSYPCDRDICSCCRYQPVLLVAHCANVTVRGGGTIDGQGAAWWARFKAKPQQLIYGRPRLFETMFASHIVLQDLTLKDSPFWTVHLWASDSILVSRVNVVAPADSPNTDGFDPDSATNVHIVDSQVANGDDCVAIKSGMNEAGIQFGRPSAHILIERLRCVRTPISIGSEMSGGVHNVTVRGVLAAESLYIKTAVGRGGYVRDVTYGPDVKGLLSVRRPILHVLTDYDTICGSNCALPVISNVHYNGVRGSGAQAGLFACTQRIPCTNFTLSDVHLDTVLGFKCSNLTATANNVYPTFCR